VRERKKERKRERERERERGSRAGNGRRGVEASAFSERQKLEAVFWVLKCERNFKRKKEESEKKVSLSFRLID
jgi:hypothetical protein